MLFLKQPLILPSLYHKSATMCQIDSYKHSGPTGGNLAKMKFFQTSHIRHVKKAEILGYSKLFKFFVYLFSTKIYISLKMNKFVMKGKYWKYVTFLKHAENALIQTKICLKCIKSLENINYNITKYELLFIITKIFLQNHENSCKMANF